MRNEVLTPAEAGTMLGIDEATLLGQARRGELPGHSFDGCWRFSRRALLRDRVRELEQAGT